MMVCVYFGIPRRESVEPRPSWHGFTYFSPGLAVLYGAMDQWERLDWLNSAASHQVYHSPPLVLNVSCRGDQPLRHLSKATGRGCYCHHEKASIAMRAWVLARSRFVEDELAKAVASGLGSMSFWAPGWARCISQSVSTPRRLRDRSSCHHRSRRTIVGDLI